MGNKIVLSRRFRRSLHKTFKYGLTFTIYTKSDSLLFKPLTLTACLELTLMDEGCILIAFFNMSQTRGFVGRLLYSVMLKTCSKFSIPKISHLAPMSASSYKCTLLLSVFYSFQPTYFLSHFAPSYLTLLSFKMSNLAFIFFPRPLVTLNVVLSFENY